MKALSSSANSLKSNCTGNRLKHRQKCRSNWTKTVYWTTEWENSIDCVHV